MGDIRQGAGSEILARRHAAATSANPREWVRDVLIVEDDAIDADRMRATLHIILGRSITYRHAETLASAVDCVLERVPDMVFLDDYLKPDDNARETIPYIRRAGYEGPILVISGELNRQRQAELIECGADAVLHKDEVDSAVITEALSLLATGRARAAE